MSLVIEAEHGSIKIISDTLMVLQKMKITFQMQWIREESYDR